MIQAVFKDVKVVEKQSDYVLGDLTSISSGDRTATIQPFTLTASGSAVEGVLSYWYRPETSRHFLMICMRIDEKLGKELIISNFEHRFDDLSCH